MDGEKRPDAEMPETGDGISAITETVPISKSLSVKSVIKSIEDTQTITGTV